MLEIITELECTLINEENPGYLEISHQSGFLYILISRTEYKFMSLSERITRIFDILKYYHSSVLEKYPVIVETYSEAELVDYMIYLMPEFIHGK